MTAPAVDAPPVDTPTVDIPEGAVPVRLPVMAVEGMWTADGRFLEPGSLSPGVMPIALYTQVRSSHGALDGDTATMPVGALTSLTRRPGSEVTRLSTGEPFPDDSFVWEASGWMYTDVPAAPEKSAYTLVKDKVLRGNSVDLSSVDAEFEFDPDQDLAADPQPRRIRITQAVIGNSTLVGMPAFPDAYIELDGEAMELAPTPEGAMAASAVPMWRSSEVGDVCSPCVASVGPRDDEITALVTPDQGQEWLALQDTLQGAEIDPEDITPVHTGGMVALVPSNPNMLLVPGGDPANELHLTLCFLGSDVTTWRPEDYAAVQRIALEATDRQALRARLMAEAEAEGRDPEGDPVPYKLPGQEGPLEASIFSHAIFNPNGDNGQDPATVYLLDGGGHRQEIETMAADIGSQVRDAIGTTQYPEQYRPFVPHITAGYGVPVDQLTYTGPVQFDRLRVALGGDVTDYQLGGGGPIVASAAPLPPVEYFQNPQLTGPTAPTVEADGRAYGHLACWGTCHIGFAGKCITPPRSASGYAYFMVHSARAVTPDGETVDVPVGYGTVSTGHADIRRDALAAAEHYDNTGTVAFEYAVGEDEYGIWFAGRMLPGLSEEMEHKARGTVFSGDWRTIRGRLELVASLGVNTPGFPVPRVRVASGATLTLVAAGVPQPTVNLLDTDTAALANSKGDIAELLAYVREQRNAKAIADSLGQIVELTPTLHDAMFYASAQLAFELDRDHPWFEDLAPGGAVTFAKKKNWVAKAGGLPSYIKRIAKHLQAGGMTEGHAIAAAKNAAQKMCDTGDLNFPGHQDVNPGSRAEACAAIAEWNAKRKAS
jgi:hypothetical protein